uniref:Tetratricopeptide repeat protein n=1 Tax=Roseihalotalea indica TaxID=2867963 RepID=A0AA49JJF5_9BACT|nr:tetratricopeptide repeat protein [Tunicatimonas sp. TK19036]
MRLLAMLLLAFYVVSCSSKSAEEEAAQLGEIELTVTGNEHALPHFKKGLLLLHSFEYQDARNEFLKAQELDSTLAMAYWGEAMTYNHSLWGEQDFGAGVKALRKIAGNRQTDITPLEEDFLEAVSILYKPGTTKTDRDQAYADYMEKMHEQYPNNLEVAAFYALSLLGSVETRDDKVYEQGAKVAKSILAENANHPGALHYLIHSYDDPQHAFMALNAADSYSVVAPDASHALHMPSHIYVALGMWVQVVASNEASYGASVDKMEREGKSNDGRSYHAFHWLQYGYLQQGRHEDAEKLLQQMQQYTQENPSLYARRHLAYMKGTYLVETDAWQSKWPEVEVKVNDLNILVKALYHFTNGMTAFKNQHADEVQAAITAIDEEMEQEAVRMQTQNITTCSALTREVPSQLDLDYAKVMVMELKAMQAWLQQDATETERWLQEAIALDESVSYSYGPPLIVKPTRELYGEWLLETGDPEKALEQFEKGLERAPKRVRLLRGQQEAAKVIGNDALARQVEETLDEIATQKPFIDA